MGEKEASGIITSARITEMPKALFDPMPKVMVRVEGGEEEELFTYYPDELHFTPDEFVGKTVAQGRQLKVEKDIAYLRS